MHESAEEKKRTGPDRRRQPTPVLSKYTCAGGRRRIIRRREDRRQHIFIDVYSSRLFITLLFLLLLTVADSYFTIALTEKNIVVEANPIMAFYLEHSTTIFFAVKFLIAAVAVLIFCLCKNSPITKVSVAFAIIIYLTVTLYELNIMYAFYPRL
ncbi:MAG: DUF5658 family protein [Thermodesulfovibrionales bacterium]